MAENPVKSRTTQITEQEIADDTKQKVCGVRITGITTGKIVDYGVRDSMNMGAAMAPAAAACIQAHLQDFSRSPSWYDKIITGDLGAVGREILLDLLAQKKIDIGSFHTDCGLGIFDNEVQGTGSGVSGCVSMRGKTFRASHMQLCWKPLRTEAKIIRK